MTFILKSDKSFLQEEVGMLKRNGGVLPMLHRLDLATQDFLYHNSW
jgi:hypothetical protein